MTGYPTSVPRPDASGAGRPARPAVNLPLAIGLGSLALLWPLANLTGLADAIGGPATALVIFVTVAVAWIGTVGYFGVPRPVLTLTIAGATFGAVVVGLGAVLGEHPNGVVLVVASLFELAQATVLGSLAGLVALAVQKSRGGHR